MLQKKLAEIKLESKKLILQVKDIKALEGLKIKYLGKKGLLTAVLRSMKGLSISERPVIGKLANELKRDIIQWLEIKEEELKKEGKEKKLSGKAIDLTMPGRKPDIGRRHPLTLILKEIQDIFIKLGFQIVEGPEVEYEYYNFEALNTPEDHPARDEQDSFYIRNKILLRTQTSPVQIRIMEKEKPPLRIIAPGKCYRRDAIDASHIPMFHQVEGLMVDKNITFGDLKGVLEIFLRNLFGKSILLRFRPSFFPFTEPSAEISIGCIMCRGAGCSVCGQTGWVEILGAGMVDPEVFKRVSYNPEVYTGFAFGMGVERITMLKYGIDDIRLFFNNDLRFLEQF